MQPRPRPDRHAFLELPRRPLRIVLDGVSHLPNLGTMFRLCDAFRVERLYVCGFPLDPGRRKFLKAASGTSRWVPWELRADAEGVTRESQALGYSVAVVELGEGSVAPHELRSDAPVCLVLGAERHGVSRAVMELADQRIEIPTDGIGGSINLTTAAAIVLYEAARKFPLAAPPLSATEAG